MDQKIAPEKLGSVEISNNSGRGPLALSYQRIRVHDPDMENPMVDAQGAACTHMIEH